MTTPTRTTFIGDCRDILDMFYEDNSFDSIVCDPPYGLSDHDESDVRACMRAWLDGKPYLHAKKGFMGQTWDSFVPGPEPWREMYRVLKPGGYMLVFASTRTDDLMSMAIRLAGFRKHPFLAWIFGSGFPKAANLSKAFDKAAGARGHDGHGFNVAGVGKSNGGSKFRSDHPDYVKPVGCTDAAKQWDGWYYGLQSLKPALEPILMFQKPHVGRMTDNVLQFGTGALNIDACRVATEPGGRPLREVAPLRSDIEYNGNALAGRVDGSLASSKAVGSTDTGRWPANLIHSGEPEVVALFPDSKGQQGALTGDEPSDKTNTVFGDFGGRTPSQPRGDSGSAARFFYCAKSSKKDRNEGFSGLLRLRDDLTDELRAYVMAELKAFGVAG